MYRNFKCLGSWASIEKTEICRLIETLTVLLMFSDKNVGASWMLILRVNKMNTCIAFGTGALTAHSFTQA